MHDVIVGRTIMDARIREFSRADAVVEIATAYLAFGGMLAAALLLMKFVVAMQWLGSPLPPDF